MNRMVQTAGAYTATGTACVYDTEQLISNSNCSKAVDPTDRVSRYLSIC